ncbi:acyl-CoA carboxylase epsilon subunit [Streptomyces marokkonensis]|uniref:acyl-CoA carboxylase epsilon subunit n=1 Tax=Streptomyces marokkonensis TaxID=324855 RepID=UPI003CCA9724
MPVEALPCVRVERGRPTSADIAALLIAPAHLRRQAGAQPGGPTRPLSGTPRAAWRHLERRRYYRARPVGATDTRHAAAPAGAMRGPV